MPRCTRLLALLGLLVFPAATWGAFPLARPRQILLEGTTPSNLRDRLIAFADSALAGTTDDRILAGEASAYVAASLDRAGRADSAMVWRERARLWRGTAQEVLDEVDSRLRRRAPGDVEAALGLLAPWRPQAAAGPFAMRLALAQALAGHPDSAARLFEAAPEELRLSQEWAYWLGRAYARAGRHEQAIETLLPLAVASRKQDADVMRMLREATEARGSSRGLEGALNREIAVNDTMDLRLMLRLGGRLLQLPADDGFPLECTVVGASPRSKRSAIVLLASPTEPFADSDSLIAQCLRAGLAVIRLDPRGSGRNVGPTCPSRDAWRGNEERLEALVARDVRTALRAVARHAAVDTTRYAVAGVGPSATSAVIAARLDPAVRAVLLVEPSPDPVEAGPMRATLVALARPTFIQLSAEAFEAGEIATAIVDACPPGRVRVADSGRGGRGAAIFRADAAIGKRFTDWLQSAWATPRATPPKRPR